MKFMVAIVVLLSGCGTWEAVAEVAAEPTVQAAVEDTVEHALEVAANPWNPYSWIGLVSGLVAIATATVVAVKKKRKKEAVSE